MGRLDSTKPQSPTDKKSVFIIGLAPENYRVSVFPGTVKDGRFTQDPLMVAAFHGAADHGYVVAKATAGATYAITLVKVVHDEKSIVGSDFQPCADGKTLVFKVQSEKVIYVGSFEFHVSNKDFDMRYWNDLDGARRYMSTTYPALADSVEQGTYELLPTTLPCSRTIEAPVNLPR